MYKFTYKCTVWQYFTEYKAYDNPCNTKPDDTNLYFERRNTSQKRLLKASSSPSLTSYFVGRHIF